METFDTFSLALGRRLDDVHQFAAVEIQKLKKENVALLAHLQKLEQGRGVSPWLPPHEHDDNDKGPLLELSPPDGPSGASSSPPPYQSEPPPALHEEHHRKKSQHHTDLHHLPHLGHLGDVGVCHALTFPSEIDSANFDLPKWGKDIKGKLRDRGLKEKYDVTHLYKTRGCWQRMAKSWWFENITLAVVVFNGLWIAVDVDWNKGTNASWTGWMVMDNFFCIYFTGELVIRFMAFEKKHQAFCDTWFNFDTVLVLMMVFETWVMALYSVMSGNEGQENGNAQVLRLLRLLRLSRMAKMMRSVPELMILIKGTVVGIRSVAITLGLLGGITFVFAIAMTTLTADTEVGASDFTTVPQSAYTLLIQGVLPDNGEMMGALMIEKWYFAVLFFIFIFLAALTFMNMLIGILCEAVHGVSVEETESMDILHMKEMLFDHMEMEDEIFEQADKKDKIVTKSIFLKVMEKDMVWDALLTLDVDIPSLIDNATSIFEDSNKSEMKFEDFIEVLLKFRATDASMIKVIFEVRALVFDRMAIVDKKLEKIAGMCHPDRQKPVTQVHHPVKEDLQDIKQTLNKTVSFIFERSQSQQFAFWNSSTPVSQGDAKPHLYHAVTSPLSAQLEAVQKVPGEGVVHSSEFASDLQHGGLSSAPQASAHSLIQNEMTLLENAAAAVKANASSTIDNGQLAQPSPEPSPLEAQAEFPKDMTTTVMKLNDVPSAISIGVGAGPAAVPTSFVTSSVGAAMIGRPQHSASEPPKIEESRAVLQDELQEQPRLLGLQVTIPPLPTKEQGDLCWPPEVTGQKVSMTQTETEVGNGVAQLNALQTEDGYHIVRFTNSVPNQGLGLRVSWDAEQPFACAVIDGGESDRQGIQAGDVLAEINGVATHGKTKEDLLPLLSRRPLAIKVLRNSACTTCGHCCLPDATFCQKCGTKRPACLCGNILMLDEDFCRKCGGRRI